MRPAGYALALLGLSALGCPLLIDDRLEVVPTDVAVNDGDGGAPTGEPMGTAGAPAAPACGDSLLPSGDPACPAVCDRCEAGKCIFECATQDGCKDRAIDCPNGLGCQVVCSAKAACDGAVVACSTSYDCELECGEVDACKEAQVQCGNGNCNVRCLADNACDKLAVTCGSAQCGAECLGPGAAPMLNCGPACSCSPCPGP